MSKTLPSIVKTVREYKPIKVDYKTQKTISFSQFSQYSTCPHQWALNYIHKHQQYTPSIHTVFGTALHETVQAWLDVLYKSTISKANEMDLNGLLMDRMRKIYKKEKYKVNWKDFSTSKEMLEFYKDGTNILKHLVSKRSEYFSKKKTYLAGIEAPLVFELKKDLYFNGFIDMVFYDESFDRFLLVDLKTSTSGWNSYQKKDEIKTSQLLLYKYFFSETFNVPIESIDVEFMVVRRKINEELDFVPKRVQRVVPASGKIKMGKVKTLIKEFVNNAFDQDGKYQKKSFPTNPSKSNCRFCPFKDNTSLCSDGIK